MNLTVKTLKGGRFTIEVDPANTVAEVKTVIETTKSELPAASMKLIHSGKVLKDDSKIESCNIKPNDFLVVMIAKPKKGAAPKPAAAAAAPVAAAAPAAAAPVATSETSASTPVVPTTPAPTAAVPPTPAAPGPNAAAAATATTPAALPAASTVASPAADAGASSSAAAPAGQEFSADVVNNLMTLGFPEAEVRACLSASNGNPDVAVEFLSMVFPRALVPAAEVLEMRALLGVPHLTR